MSDSAIDLYLDLLKKTLTFMLWPEPPVPLAATDDRRSTLGRAAAHGLDRLVGLVGMRLVTRPEYTQAQREEGRVWPGYADTMVGLKRLDNLQRCVQTALADGVEGDLIETGVWRGGSCIFMRGILAAHGVSDRRVFVADSFQGLPRPEADGHPLDANDELYTRSVLAVSQQQVEDNFRRYGLLDDQVVFLKGWFRDTLPEAPIDKLAVMRLDGDMYGSTMDGLNNLYPKLQAGGFCIIDDYSLESCSQAVHDYREAHGIDEPIEAIDWTGRFWRKAT